MNKELPVEMKEKIPIIFWVMGGSFVALVLFAILKPFLWHWILKQHPVEACDTLSSLLTITIALLALGIGAFGWVTYRIVSRRLLEKTKREAECFHEETRKEVARLHEEAMKKAIRLYEESRKEYEQEYHCTMVRLHSHVCSLWGRMYQILKPIIKKELQPLLISFADNSVLYGKRAIDLTKKLDEKKQKDLIVTIYNNYAMSLALRGDRKDAKIAEGVIKYLESQIEDYSEMKKLNYEDTIIFLRLRIPIDKDDLLKAEQDLTRILEDPRVKGTLLERIIKQKLRNFPKSSF